DITASSETSPVSRAYASSVPSGEKRGLPPRIPAGKVIVLTWPSLPPPPPPPLPPQLARRPSSIARMKPDARRDITTSALGPARHTPEDAGHGGEEGEAEDLVGARAQAADQRVLEGDRFQRGGGAVEGAQHRDDDAGDGAARDQAGGEQVAG